MLRAEHLSFSVTEEGKKRTIIDDISFEVEPGEMLVITGPNGSGKSTLVKLLMGIEPADQGRIFIVLTKLQEHRVPVQGAGEP